MNEKHLKKALKKVLKILDKHCEIRFNLHEEVRDLQNKIENLIKKLNNE